MTTIVDVARKVVEQKQAHLYRPRLDKGIEVGLDWKAWGTGGNKRGWTLLDLFSASAVLAVFDHISEEHQKRMLRLRATSAVLMCLKLVRRAA